MKRKLKDEMTKLANKLVLRALEKHDWRLGPAAEECGCSEGTLRYRIRRNPVLSRAWAKHGHGRGQPRKQP